MTEWVNCPICGESDMRFERADCSDELGMIACTNLSCPSNVRAGPAVEAVAPWRCFHCGETFVHTDRAAAHFGTEEDQRPACQIKASEGGLLRALRDAESDARRAWGMLHGESADGLKAWRRAEGRHHMALTAMEQTGYERGLRDARAERDRLLDGLRPFAGKADKWEANHPPGWNAAHGARDSVQVQHRLGDFRAARALLREVEGPTEGVV